MSIKVIIKLLCICYLIVIKVNQNIKMLAFILTVRHYLFVMLLTWKCEALLLENV